MQTIYFIRHGESVSNAGGVSLEHHAIPLTALGIQQAQILADTWPMQPAQILVSELVRSQQTAQPLCAKYGMAYQINPLLNELHILSHELIVGMTGEQRRPLAQAYWTTADINQRLGLHADTFNEFCYRVEQFITSLTLLANHTVIVGHGIWFGLLVWRLMGFTAHDRATMLAFRAFQTKLPLANGIRYSLRSHDGQHWCIRYEP